MEKLLLLGDGSLIQGIVILSFAIIGLILFIKGAIANLDELAHKFTFRKDWQVGAFFTIFILSYIAFVYAITRLL